jgi:hypothetical protein
VPGSLSFAGPATTLGNSPTVEIVAADFNLDGINDVVSLNATGTHQIYDGAGNNSFTLHPQQFSSPTPTGSAVGDFNNDGRIDLAVSTGASGLDIFLNDGRGNLGRGDVDPPTLNLTGQASIALAIGDAYNDAGATATDTADGDVTSRIVVTNPVDTNVIGTYTVTYHVTDRSGNKATPVTRSVSVGTQKASGGGGGGGSGPLFVVLMGIAWVVLGRSSEPRRVRNRSGRPRVLGDQMGTNAVGSVTAVAAWPSTRFWRSLWRCR